MSLESLTQLPAQQRRLISLGIIGIVTAVMLVYSVLPQVKSYRSKATSRASLAEVGSQDAVLLEQIESRMREIERLSRLLHGDSVDLPVQQVESFVIGRLQKISWDHGIELISVRPGEGAQVERFREMLFSVELEGTYVPVHRWLLSVREELGFVVIKEFSLVRSDSSPVDPRLRATLTMASYRMISS